MRPPPRLHGYFRSSASWRVRIALALKHIEYETAPINLRAGEQHSEAFRQLNPGRLVPILEIDGARLAQSLPIIEYLDERFPAPPLLPLDPLLRARVRAFAQHIASEIHPLNNLRVLNYLKTHVGLKEAFVNGEWYSHWITEGFDTLESLAEGPLHCFGGAVTLADVCLIPQIGNALRFHVDLAPFPKLRSIASHLNTLDAFQAAHPQRHPDRSSHESS